MQPSAGSALGIKTEGRNMACRLCEAALVFGIIVSIFALVAYVILSNRSA